MRRQIAMLALGLVVFSGGTTTCRGGILFTDSTFNLANYSQASYLDNPSATISTAQILSGGNPGAALQILADNSSLTAYSSFQGFVNTTFVYNPSTQGPLMTIDASVDKIFSFGGNFLANSFRPLILQGGNYFSATIVLPTTKNAWLTGSQAGLVASDFALFNFTTGIFDPSQNPNFANGIMEFGILNRISQTAVTRSQPVDVRYDNLSLQLNNPVPEPQSFILVITGAASVLIGRGLRKASARFSPHETAKPEPRG